MRVPGRTEKIRDKQGKEKIRKGTKSANTLVQTGETTEIRPFLNRIICGDAAEVLASLPNKSVDIIITSPPYNFGHSYAQDPHDDTREWNEYFLRLDKVWNAFEY